MFSDSYFEQGTTHEVCEDYAVHGEDYAIVADGCSNGGGPSIDSDWGARFICKAAEEFVDEFDPHRLLSRIRERICYMMAGFPLLSQDAMTATLMMMRILDSNFHAFTVGDGVVGGKRKDGRWKIHVIDFNSAPFYLKYNLFGEERMYYEAFGDKYKIITYFGKLMDPKMEIPEFPKFFEREAEWSQTMTRSEMEYTLDMTAPFNIFEFPIEEYDFAFVCSDGMEQFKQLQIGEGKKANEKISVLDALRIVLDFPILSPIKLNFAKHQRNWTFKQDRPGTILRRKWKNHDDVAVGIIHA
jgi:serine/threonine protein phosphatase PrpC